MLHIIALICAYEPQEILIKLVDELLQNDFPYIVIVNDGSSAATEFIFQKISENPRVRLLHHPTNRGKGAALKTGFDFIYKRNDATHVICIDADGQHEVSDVLNLSKVSKNEKDALIIGVRTFDQKTPLRNRMGNFLSRIAFKYLIGIKLQDSQTGLRAIPICHLALFIQIPNNRFDYETKQLIVAFQQAIPIIQVPIKTIYPKESHSHFRIFIDSPKIYRVFMDYWLKRLISFGRK